MGKTILTLEMTGYILLNTLVKEESECWPFLNISHSFFDKDGYGIIRIQSNYIRTTYRAHRLSYMYYNKIHKLDENVQILHACDNPICQNPDHLFAGDNDMNMKDRDFKNRQPKGEKNGMAKLTAKEVLEIRRRFYIEAITEVELARQYGVSKSLISAILLYKCWKHI